MEEVLGVTSKGIATSAFIICGVLLVLCIVGWLYSHYKELPKVFWEDLEKEIQNRDKALANAKTKTKEQVCEQRGANVLTLSATDVFVEKAQMILTRRATRLVAAGIALSTVTFTLCIVAFLVAHYQGGKIWEIMTQGNSAIRSRFVESPNFVYLFVLYLLSFLASGAVLGGLIYYSVALSRALFHEATTLLKRRHALRFGRLVVYSQIGEMSVEEMERAFKWSEEFSSAFKDIQAEKIGKSVINVISDSLGGVLSESVKAAKEKQKP